MNDTISFINSLAPGIDIAPREEQWAMSYAYNEQGMSLPEYHPEESGASADALEPVSMGATDPDTEDVAKLVQELLAGINIPKFAQPSDISGVLEKFMQPDPAIKAKAQKDMFTGAVMKTVAAAGDLFTRALGIGYQLKDINAQRDVAVQNYQNQIDAIDNQVIYIKHQLADRFNKTVETNIMNLAAKNIRVNAGNVLDLSKEEASEITEDMRTAESNARLKQIAMEAGQKQVKESAKYEKKQLWTGLIGSAVKLGITFGTGGGTGEKWGDLYTGYKKALDFEKAQKAGTLTGMYE